MTQSEPTYQLIAWSIPADTPELARLRPLLARKYRLDAFILQQRMVGRGPNLIAEGSRQRLDGIAELLAGQGLRCQVIEARPPRFAPLRLRGIHIGADRLNLLADGRTVTLEPHHRVMAVLADLSGQAAAKNLRHLMAQRTYSGIDAPRPIDDETLTKAILRGKPVLDLYRLNEQGRIDAGIRVMPGRFDPKGLEEHASLSAVGNLQAVLEQVRDKTADCRLVLDFGLANLPGCRLKSPEETSRWEQDNLAALTCFGWLMADLATAESLQPVTAPHLQPILETLQKGLQDDPPAPADPPMEAATLPPPPSGGGRQSSRNPGLAIGFIAAVGFGLASASGPELLATVFRYGVRTAILPALLTGACLWGAFHVLRLKQHVQNTPTSKVRSMAMGLVELQGRAVRKYALVSPISQLSCVFYRVRKYRRDRKNNWRLAHSEDSGHVPFFLEDETGRVMIDPRGASVSARCKQESYGDRGTGLFGAFGGNSDEKWVEEIVPEGTRLYILGQARENRHAGSSLRERVTRALRELKRDPQALQRYDSDGNGRICASEWEQARAGIEQQILEQSLAANPAPSAVGDRVVVCRPRQRSIPYVIAETESETHLVRNYALLTLPLFAGGLGGLVWTLISVNNFLQP